MRVKIYSIVSVILFLTVPWFFFDFSETQILGLPVWGFYSFVLTVTFAVTVAFFIGKYWDALSDSGEDE